MGMAKRTLVSLAVLCVLLLVSITQGTVREEVDVTQTEMAVTVLLFVVIPELVLVGVLWYFDF